VAARLFVHYLYVPQIGVDQRVIGGQIRSTGNAEDVVNTFSFEGLEQCVCGSHRTNDPSNA